MSLPIEQEIVALLKNGDKKAIVLLYENYSGALLGVIKKVISDDAIANDVLQESFIKVWKKSKTYDASKAKLFTWLYRVFYNSAIDKARALNNKTKKEIQIQDSNVYKLATQSVNFDTLDIKKHLSRLDLKYQVVINALYFEGMTQQEASEDLSIPLGTIKSRLKIGLRELKKIYNPKSLL